MAVKLGTTPQRLQVLNYSPTARASISSGYIVSVMGVDCTIISFNAQLMLSPLPGLLSMPIVIYMLSARIGVGPGLCCGSVLLAALVGFWLFVLAYYKFQRRSMKFRDDRVKRMLDLLSSIRTVKMYAWEQSHLDSLKRLREKELKNVLKINLINGAVDAIYSAMSSLTKPALGRVVTLCTAEEFQTITRWNRLLCSERYVVASAKKFTGEVFLQDCTYSRTNREDCEPALERINLSVPAGSLVAIIGFVGSGKSTLLSAILGDLHRVKGIARINGTIGYVPQAATVFNATLRDNILFGKPYEPILYRRVLEACELVKDINTFPARDHTEIGEKVS
ncbi:hypothetical protein HPB49_026022 [Dermacentor silvarum]|nr:hypothetical protein HPB49_026022 [Dermacentor silvarum]